MASPLAHCWLDPLFTFLPFMPGHHSTPAWNNFSLHLCSDESCPFSRDSVLSFFLLHGTLHEGLRSLPSCNSCITSCIIISYSAIHLEITWYFGLLDCVCVCLCEILPHDFKPLISETNCFICFYKSFQKLSMYSVSICWLLLKTNVRHH